jgi:hypothetical protein
MTASGLGRVETHAHDGLMPRWGIFIFHLSPKYAFSHGQGQNEKPAVVLCQLPPAADIAPAMLTPLCANWRPEQMQQNPLLDHVLGEYE